MISFTNNIWALLPILLALGLMCLCCTYLDAKKSVAEFVDDTFKIKGKEYHYSYDLRLMINEMEDLKIMCGKKTDKSFTCM